MAELIERLPPAVRSKAEKAGAEAWLNALPSLIADLESEWSISTGRVYQDASEACVMEATLADGTPAVLKLLIPRRGDAARNEIKVLELTQGEGCARLYRHDAARNALLIERLGPSMADLGLPIRERLALLCDAAQRLWRPAPGSGFPTGAQKGRWLVDFIEGLWEELDRPCSEQAVAFALACAERRIAAHDDARAVLVHGDVHQWNALRAVDGPGFKLVDPDGLLAEAEYDLGILLREDPVELMQGDPRERARWLAARTGLNAEAIWEWGAIERMSTGLLLTQIDLQPVGRDMLAVADWVAQD